MWGVFSGNWLTEKQLSEAFSHINQVLDTLRDNDPNMEQSIHCCRIIEGTLRCSKELYQTKKKKAV